MKPAQFTIKEAIRSNILSLAPYVCARDEYDYGKEGVLLDANENALGHSLPPRDDSSSSSNDDGTTEFDDLSLHRYPSPSHLPLKQRICDLRKIPSTSNVFLGVGSDEVIDLLFRITCAPRKDRVLVCPPTYGMYGVCAQINDVEVVKCNLDVREGAFKPKVDEINKILSEAAGTSQPIKLTFLCSPGNPTGTLIPLDDIRSILANSDYKGLVVVDEAYIDFGPDGSSATNLLVEEGWDNLVIMQTLSKGFGLAGIRLGLAISTPELIQILNNVKAPYNVSTPTANLAMRALSPQGLEQFRRNIATLLASRTYLERALLQLPGVIRTLGHNDANFLLVQIGDEQGSGTPDNERAKRVYKTMAESDKVVVRFRGHEVGCEACLRVTVGTRDECDAVIDKMTRLLK